MRDWGALVEQRLAGLVLEPGERAEVISEVAAHLEDLCEEMLRQGMTEEEAVRRALSQTGDWQDLQRKILTAKRGEQVMEKRVRQLWVPGFLTLILSMLFLTALQRFGFDLASFGAARTRFFCICPGCSRFLSSGLWEPTSRPGPAARGEPCSSSAFFLRLRLLLRSCSCFRSALRSN